MQVLLAIDNIARKKLRNTLTSPKQAKFLRHFPFISFIVEKKFFNLRTQFAAKLITTVMQPSSFFLR